MSVKFCMLWLLDIYFVIDGNISSVNCISLKTNELTYSYFVSTSKQIGRERGFVRGVIKNYGTKWSFRLLSSDSYTECRASKISFDG